MTPIATPDMNIAANILYQYLSEWQGGCAPKCLHIHNRNIYTTYSRPTYNNLYVELYAPCGKATTSFFTHYPREPGRGHNKSDDFCALIGFRNASFLHRAVHLRFHVSMEQASRAFIEKFLSRETVSSIIFT